MAFPVLHCPPGVTILATVKLLDAGMIKLPSGQHVGSRAGHVLKDEYPGFTERVTFTASESPGLLGGPVAYFSELISGEDGQDFV
jgi:hypothetical protein